MVLIYKGIGALLAAAAGFIAITLLLVFFSWACKRRNPKLVHTAPAIHNRKDQSPTELISITLDKSTSFDSNLHISMAELVRATEMFSPDLIVGDGGFGWVYKATLSNGTTVAIKKLSPDAFQGFREFRAEMETLGKLQHPNIVKILGYCASNSERILVYEFIEKGSLDQWLYESSSEGKEGGASLSQPLERPPLCWDTRVKIVTGVARGLSYLHGLPKPIIHRDIKASNILLDGDFEAHIADFGLARRIDTSSTHVSTQAAGTMGYMPPEYKEGLTLAKPTVDIYSFGILLLEIFTGRRPNLPMAITVGVKERKEVCLIEWVRKMVAEGKEMEMVDWNICRESLNEGKVKEYIGIALRCTSDESKRRPAMEEVMELLKRASLHVDGSEGKT